MLSHKLKSLLTLQNLFREECNLIHYQDFKLKKIKMIQIKRIDLVLPKLNLMTKTSKKWYRQLLKEHKPQIYQLSHYLWQGHSAIVLLNIQKNSISVSIRNLKCQETQEFLMPMIVIRSSGRVQLKICSISVLLNLQKP